MSAVYDKAELRGWACGDLVRVTNSSNDPNMQLALILGFAKHVQQTRGADAKREVDKLLKGAMYAILLKVGETAAEEGKCA